MGNYKSTKRTITVGGVTTFVPDGAIIKTLQDPVLVSNAPDSMIDDNATLYQVPAGKQYFMVGIKVWGEVATGGGTVNMYSGDTEDAITTQANVIYLTTTPTTESQEYYTTYTFLATKFIIVDPSTTNVKHLQVLGYEL